ncbi:MAG TPA: MFS transporter [Phycisphaerales bacterium]|nr:MFS transporter [Phycisphaerales bacterium]HMP37837.1 MFS transporter [Phycisphaerales bacterium]
MQDAHALRRLQATALLSFSAGLPLALTGDVLQAWMVSLGRDVKTTGAVILVGLPMALQALWAPFVDRFAPPIAALGRRRSWMLASQSGLALGVAAMALCGPDDATASIAPLLAIATAVAFAAAFQEIAFNAWRSEVFPDRSRALGASIYVAGYRVAMIASSAGVLVLAARWSWQGALCAAAAAVAIGILGTLLAPEPPEAHARPPSVADAVLTPLRAFLGSGGGMAILVFVLLYKLPDYLLGNMTIPLLHSAGMSLERIGVLRSGFGIAMTIAGALLGGAILVRISLRRALIAFGVLQLASNAGFLLPAAGFTGTGTLLAVIAVESVCTGLVAAAFVAFFMASCDRRHAATQYALLTTVMLVGSRLAGPVAGVLAARLGWTGFVLLTIAAGVPGLLLLARVPIRERSGERPSVEDALA